MRFVVDAQFPRVHDVVTALSAADFVELRRDVLVVHARAAPDGAE